MADEEIKNEEIVPAAVEATEEIPAETKQEELPLAAAEEAEKTEEKPAEVAEEPKVEEPKPDWRERELKAKHRQLQEAKRREVELQRRAEAAEALAAKFNQTNDKSPELPVVPASEVEKRAQELLAQQRYLDECNKTAQKGETTYSNGWKEAVSNLEMLGGFDQATMNGALATDDPAKVLYELGKNPDQYHRIMEMPLERRIIEMSKIAMAQTQVKKVSEAPAPVTTVGGRSAPSATVLSDDMDDPKWFQTRRAQRRAKWEAANAPRR
jgi:hypothetical protein